MQHIKIGLSLVLLVKYYAILPQDHMRQLTFALVSHWSPCWLVSDAAHTEKVVPNDKQIQFLVLLCSCDLRFQNDTSSIYYNFVILFIVDFTQNYVYLILISMRDALGSQC